MTQPRVNIRTGRKINAETNYHEYLICFMVFIKLLNNNKHPNGHFTILSFFNLNVPYNIPKYSDEAPSPKEHYTLCQKNSLIFVYPLAF